MVIRLLHSQCPVSSKGDHHLHRQQKKWATSYLNTVRVYTEFVIKQTKLFAILAEANGLWFLMHYMIGLNKKNSAQYKSYLSQRESFLGFQRLLVRAVEERTYTNGSFFQNQGIQQQI